MRTRQRAEVGLLQSAIRLLCDALDDGLTGAPVHWLARVFAAAVASKSRGLEIERENVILAQEELDGLADLMLVRAARGHEDELGGNPQLLQDVQRGVLVGDQVAAANLLVRIGGKTVELKSDIGAALLDGLRERLVAAQAQAVGDDDHPADLRAARDTDELEDLRVAGGLAARKCDGLAVAFARDHSVDDSAEIVERHMFRIAVVDDADGALEVAVVRHLDDGQAGVLLVLVADAAVGGTAVLRLLRVM